jgi:hypothetical protein
MYIHPDWNPPFSLQHTMIIHPILHTTLITDIGTALITVKHMAFFWLEKYCNLMFTKSTYTLIFFNEGIKRY